MGKKYVTKIQVKGSRGDMYTVAVDENGEYSCSCPVWKFRRQECKHIDYVKNNPQLLQGNGNYLTATPGNVGEVTIYRDDRVLYPLVPLGREYTAHLIATIIYDMVRAKVDPAQVNDYKDRMFQRKVSIKQINDHVKQYGRLVFSEWIQGRGWTNPAAVSHDMPLKRTK